MYQYVFVSVFYFNIDWNNFKLSVHRNPRLIKSHSVIAPLYQPIKFSSETSWIWSLSCDIFFLCDSEVKFLEEFNIMAGNQKVKR